MMCKILRISGRKVDKEMPTVLCVRILIHTANEQPLRIQDSVTRNNRKCGKHNYVFQIKRHFEKKKFFFFLVLYDSLKCVLENLTLLLGNRSQEELARYPRSSMYKFCPPPSLAPCRCLYIGLIVKGSKRKRSNE